MRAFPEIVDVVPHISLGSAPDDAPSHDQEPTILFFGRIWEYKGLEYLIRAEPLITAEVPNAKIVIAGEGEDFDRYRRLMVHPERFVVYNEYVSDDVRATLFQQASVVALPYIEASQSGVLPLAYMHMKPVVATTVGGLPEMVDDGSDGISGAATRRARARGRRGSAVARRRSPPAVWPQRQAQARRGMRSGRLLRVKRSTSIAELWTRRRSYAPSGRDL